MQLVLQRSPKPLSTVGASHDTDTVRRHWLITIEEKMIKLFKKVLSVISLSFGVLALARFIHLVTVEFFLSFVIRAFVIRAFDPVRLADFVLQICIFALYCILFILLGLVLWDWKRRRIVLGIVLTIHGGYLILMSTDLIVLGVASIASGILLIDQQKRIDKKLNQRNIATVA